MKVLHLILFLLVTLTASAKWNNLTESDKAAIVMVHFGTSFDDTREATIDRLNSLVKERFPEYTVEEAFTSRMIIKKLKSRGIIKHTPTEIMMRLAYEGYTHVFIQCSNMLEGTEVEVIRQEAAMMKPFFKEIRIGKPLLYSIDDCQRVTDILISKFRNEDANIVMVGHGSPSPSNAVYSQIDYMFTAAGHPEMHVATIEGYPTLSTLEKRLAECKATRVILMPLMFVAGDHARNDIAGDWVDALDSKGYQASALMESLGMLPEIQEMYIEHIVRGMADDTPSHFEKKKLDAGK